MASECRTLAAARVMFPSVLASSSVRSPASRQQQRSERWVSFGKAASRLQTPQDLVSAASGVCWPSPPAHHEAQPRLFRVMRPGMIRFIHIFQIRGHKRQQFQDMAIEDGRPTSLPERWCTRRGGNCAEACALATGTSGQLTMPCSIRTRSCRTDVTPASVSSSVSGA